MLTCQGLIFSVVKSQIRLAKGANSSQVDKQQKNKANPNRNEYELEEWYSVTE